jgi:hypothetical protein
MPVETALVLFLDFDSFMSYSDHAGARRRAQVGLRPIG